MTGTTAVATEFRRAWALFLAAPVLWALHFLLVYLVGEAACSPAVSEPPESAVSIFTVVVTAVAAVATAVVARRGYGRWQTALAAERAGDPDRAPHAVLAFGGFVLGLLFTVGVLFVGLPAAVLPAC